MKFLVLSACIAASSAATINLANGGGISAGYSAVPYTYSGPLNLNTELISFPNGAVVPVDEPAVAAARADHLSSRDVVLGAVSVAAPTRAVADVPFVYSGPLNLNTKFTSFPNGAVVPVDEPAVAAARADHLALLDVVADAPFVYSGPLNLNTELKSFPNGAVVPVDEPAVASARAEHIALSDVSVGASAPVLPADGPVFPPATPFVYSGPINLNTELKSFPNGAVVPIDEPAVAAARADHLATNGFGAVGSVAPYPGLVAYPNGAVVPVDEPAVAAARAEHLKAF